jgi:alpha-amylase
MTKLLLPLPILRSLLSLCLLSGLLASCIDLKPQQDHAKVAAPEAFPFVWDNATVYFLLTDRFANGNPANDQTMGRKADAATLRGFMGGDFAGITQKINEGYFDNLGVNALWLTPPVEQISSPTDEGTGLTYAYHGYWARDWTAIDPNFGTLDELKTLITTAHDHGIRIVWDAVANHTGPVTMADPAWPASWVRIEPTCDFTGYDGTVNCTLVDNLPDFRTSDQQDVAVPAFLLAKWEKEGRLEAEMAELDAFFARTGHPRSPRYYLIKWLTDWVRELGIDAFRIDTAKHTEAEVWADLKAEALRALRAWKKANPALKPDDLDFFMTGEVYNYTLAGGQGFDYGDTVVNFYQSGFESMINFGFKDDAEQTPEALFSQYSAALHGGPLDGLSVLNYLSSHDDGEPFDPARAQPKLAGTLLLLAPGSAQIYYGDETARPLTAEGAEGDANLRTFMNWEDLDEGKESTLAVLTHWQKLGQFRRAHPAVGAGSHAQLQAKPYVFRRSYRSQENLYDEVVVGMGLVAGEVVTLPIGDAFAPGTELTDYYSGQTITVADSVVQITPAGSLVLLGR